MIGIYSISHLDTLIKYKRCIFRCMKNPFNRRGKNRPFFQKNKDSIVLVNMQYVDFFKKTFFFVKLKEKQTVHLYYHNEI